MKQLIISRWQVPYLVVWQIIAAFLLASWFIEPTKTFWLECDETLFRFLNESLRSGQDSWRMLWAVMNHRAFDAVSASLLASVFIVSAWRHGRSTWAWHAAVVSVTVLAVLIGTRIGHLIPVERPSATMLHQDAFRLNHWASGFETKDISYSTFPGDHGMVAMIGFGYAFHYLGKFYAWAAFAAGWIVVVPRLVSGAHWLSDELVGAGFIGILVLSWSFYTPVADYLVEKLERYWRKVWPVVVSD